MPAFDRLPANTDAPGGEPASDGLQVIPGQPTVIGTAAERAGSEQSRVHDALAIGFGSSLVIDTSKRVQLARALGDEQHQV